MDPVQAEAVKATGGSWFQWINYAVQPQVMRMIGLGLYRLDINFRRGGGRHRRRQGDWRRLEQCLRSIRLRNSGCRALVIIHVMIVEYTSGYVRRQVQ